MYCHSMTYISTIAEILFIPVNLKLTIQLYKLPKHEGLIHIERYIFKLIEMDVVNLGSFSSIFL